MTKQNKAEKLYESSECERLFEEAWKAFPRYNTDQAEEAADWIFDHLTADNELTDAEQTELYENIYAGLT